MERSNKEMQLGVKVRGLHGQALGCPYMIFLDILTLTLTPYFGTSMEVYTGSTFMTTLPNCPNSRPETPPSPKPP